MVTALRYFLVFVVAVTAAYLLAVGAYTAQIVGATEALVAAYTPSSLVAVTGANLAGLWVLGAVICTGLAIAFIVAALLRLVIPLPAPIAFALAGGSAMLVIIYLIEQQLGGGAGVIGGARTPVGLALQGLAGAVAGFLFGAFAPRMQR